MPNWCWTQIRITSCSEEKLKDLCEKIKEWTSKPYIKNDWDNNWLGNVVGFSGIAKWNEEDHNFHSELGIVACRGCIESVDYKDGNLQINTETAWTPMVQLWELICQKYLYDDYELFYVAEEGGNCIYTTNDPNVEGTYIIDIYDTPPDDLEWESQWEVSEEVVIKFCQEAFKTDETDLDKLLELAGESEWVGINKYEYCEIEYCS